MMNGSEPLFFDGHNDQLSLLLELGPSKAVAHFKENPAAAIDLVRAKEGRFGGGFFAVWVASEGMDINTLATTFFDVRIDIPLPNAVPFPLAEKTAFSQIAILLELERAGLIKICRCVADIKTAFGSGTMAAVLHMEGAEPIGADLSQLDVFYAAGLRSLGPVWSRSNIFGHGVPFRFPAHPDTGPGLTDLGFALVKRCNELGVMLDVSHINEAGFWDVVRLTTKPIVATHSNVYALCPSSRNLTDKQLDAIADTGGLVGLNFATAFLRADGKMVTDVPFETLFAHIDHLLAKLGEDGVAFGSDYDGALVPSALKGVECLPKLREAMIAYGYGEALTRKICRDNWLGLLERTWNE